MTAYRKPDDRKEARAANSTYKKLAVPWLNEALRPAWWDFVVAASLRLRNRQLLEAANRLFVSQLDAANKRIAA